MKVHELIAVLGKMPAGAQVDFLFEIGDMFAISDDCCVRVAEFTETGELHAQFRLHFDDPCYELALKPKALKTKQKVKRKSPKKK